MTGERGVVLVTGATGFLGAAVVTGLAERGWDVRCVVRGDTNAERSAKLRTALADRSGDPLAGIEVREGDLAQPTLGLSAAEFAALGRGVARVLHCGARVSVTLPYRRLHDTNVRATESLLELAERAAAPFGFVGSVAAVARRVAGEPFELLDPVSGGYGQSKWAADRLVSVAHQEGRIRAAIFRPGRVTADSHTGRSNPDDFLEQVIRLCVRLGAAPALPTGVRLSPVDWVSRVLVDLFEEDQAYGRAYHLVSAERLSWSRVVDVLRSSGHPLIDLPYDQWRALALAAAPRDPGAARIAPALPAAGIGFDDRGALRPDHAAETLAGALPDLPPAETLLKNTVEAWRRAGVFAC